MIVFINSPTPNVDVFVFILPRGAELQEELSPTVSELPSRLSWSTIKL